jgi:hypothetical protein
MKKHNSPKKLPLSIETVRELDVRVEDIRGGQRKPWYTAGSNQDVCCA